MDAEQPLRSALFSTEQMRQHGITLAGSHNLSQRGASDHSRLTARLSENKITLLKVRALLAESLVESHKVTPAGEWLLDNFYLIEEQIRTTRLLLPKGYNRELRFLRNGPSAGLPLVYDIALEMVSHGDGRIDQENLRGFVESYQSVSVLKLGELWAIPIMLRLALIENLRRVASSIASDMMEQGRAGYWADRMIDVSEKDPKSLVLEIAEMVRSDPPMVSSFVAELSRRLQGHSPNLALPLTWIEQRLLESGSTIAQQVQSEIQQQAADQVSMSNSIGSLRTLNTTDWHEFVEAMSLVDHILAEDPGGYYRRMDFATRDRYRHVIEEIAKSGSRTEVEVAREAIRLSRECAERGSKEDRAAHVGFFLIDKGLPRLSRPLGVRPSRVKSGSKAAGRSSLFPFLGSLALLTALVSVGLGLRAYGEGLYGWALAGLAILLVLGSSRLSVRLVDWVISLVVSPQALPRLDFSKGIPPGAKTLAVVPSMLVNPGNIEELTESLEIKYLANQDENLFFALLTDFTDAPGESMDGDAALVELARSQIAGLNAKYRGGNRDRFFLFHRPRVWNPGERAWIGYERKRGKLGALNAYLRGGARDSFSLVVGDVSVLSDVKYVITLDTDTQLQRESARTFAATMEHPLNRPRIDAKSRRVVEGYGIIQPRVTMIRKGSDHSRYASLCGSEPGIDPYTRASSDVYQDLFGEGSYIGKGIYEIDAFEAALEGRFPENRILSHDLLEGCYARSGLLSDVQLLEEYPARYLVDTGRRHRWIRGDWQIARWVFRSVPSSGGQRRGNPLPPLSRWKIADNLRRSLATLALLAVVLVGWTLMPSAPFWTAAVAAIVFLPSFLIPIVEAFRKPLEIRWSQHAAVTARSAGARLAEAAFSFACLPHEAFYSLDAIARAIWRMAISHRRLLEWRTAAESSRGGRRGLAGTYAAMWVSPFVAVATAAFLWFFRAGVLPVASPALSLWFLAPALAWWLSRPLSRKARRLSAEKSEFLRKTARRTWAYFETFAGSDDNWLPPDNYQEHPVSVVAHRSSPTNMGLSLLANLAAYDFGYLTAGACLDRTERALRGMAALERYHGHFYNWYDTQSLKPLPPLYVSTVDSGNLAAYLLTLRAGLLGMADDKIVGERLFEGIRDTVAVLEETTGGSRPIWLSGLREEATAVSEGRLDSIRTARSRLGRMAASCVSIADSLKEGDESETGWWARRLAIQCTAAIEDVDHLLSWAGKMDMPDPSTALGGIPTLRELASFDGAADAFLSPDERRLFGEAGELARRRISALEDLAARSWDMAQMEYGFLYDADRHLLAIGYNVTDRRRDSGYYDLLASEARLCSFVGIAQGGLPQENWFALGRQLTTAGGGSALLSWGGSMFEYLMPLVVMPDFEFSLLDQTCKAVVARQVEYGRQLGVPWGISESGYFLIDASLNYQYRSFGIPGLGLKRGLADDLVISPYSSALALMVEPEEACANLQRLAAAGFSGRYGLYEAIDYTASRLPPGETAAVVRSFMAHHQGMSLLSLAHVLLGAPMRRRFRSEPIFQAAELLLQERIPKVTTLYSHTTEIPELRAGAAEIDLPMRVIDDPDTPTPEVQLLSNGRYSVMITNAGGGYSRWKDIAVTRWREDGTRDNWGSFCYIRDASSGETWSSAYQPTLRRPKRYEAIFSEGRAEFRRSDHGIDSHTAIVVSPEDDIEIRRTRLTNRTRSPRTLDITSYAEVVLAPQAADAQHPAFGNLFVNTEIVRESRVILCHRRPRSSSDGNHWLFHLMTVFGSEVSRASYETDRGRFLGRWNDLSSPSALKTGEELSGNEGSVLDPIVSIQYRITLEPEESATIDIISGIGSSRAEALGLAGKYQDRLLADRVFDLAYTHGQVVLRQLNATEADAQLFGRLAGSILFAHSSMRADQGLIARNRRGQSGLWGYSISGDVPIVLLQIENIANIALARQLIQAHRYWRLKGLVVDLMIWNEDHGGYRQLVNDQIMGLLATGSESNMIDRYGGVFLRSSDQISIEDRVLIQASARVIISDGRGSLAEQINRRATGKKPLPKALAARISQAPEAKAEAALPRTDLLFYNGLGGFTPDGREYIITTAPGQIGPAPWSNVLANPGFGTIVSEAGQAYTWAENAHEFRLSPWHNDPVGDTGGEAFYIRDEERGHFWSPMPLPCRGATPYVTRHGFGYSVFEHAERGIRSEAWVYVAMDESVKYTVLKITNSSGRQRRLSVTGYVEWVLGDLRSKTAMHVVTEIDPASGGLFARNGYSVDFPGRVAFLDADGAARSVSGDRGAFIGRNGSLADPAAMYRQSLSGRVGAAMDPCAAIQLPFDLADGEEREVIFRLGAGRDAKDASGLMLRVRGSYAARTALEGVWRHWNRVLGAIYVETPDRSLNCMANGWLIYQTLACRLWGRSGFYQSGGAFGFRDQLQDTMALVFAEPRLAREQLLLCASRQFVEGDVQHWWHPPSGRGIRSRCSDDFLWLPMAAARYVAATGDSGVMDENAAYLEGRQVGSEEDSYYDLPNRSRETGSLYDHCRRALERGERYGEHGLPLMGSGDWNDGMNLVGIGGKGESVWLGFFFYKALSSFAPIAEARGDAEYAAHCLSEAETLRSSLERHGWDGGWYRRAYFDDGHILGSAESPECSIDSIAQSWSVLSGAGDPGRSRSAMDALDDRLVSRKDSLIKLLAPPFDESEPSPGYIKGYVPGVRENGGQYTHAAVWAAMAFAELGDGSRAWELASMMNPINHSSSPGKTAIYKVEPYVLAGDVYAQPPHTGRGGWTWYTGSAGWMYRLIVESLLGVRLEADRLRLDSCVPEAWDSFKIHYRHRETFYHILVTRGGEGEGASLALDGAVLEGDAIPLVDDRREHTVEARLPVAPRGAGKARPSGS